MSEQALGNPAQEWIDSHPDRRTEEAIESYVALAARLEHAKRAADLVFRSGVSAWARGQQRRLKEAAPYAALPWWTRNGLKRRVKSDVRARVQAGLPPLLDAADPGCRRWISQVLDAVGVDSSRGGAPRHRPDAT